MNVQEIAKKIFQPHNSMDEAISNACLEYNLSNKQSNELKICLKKMKAKDDQEMDFLYYEDEIYEDEW